MDMEKNQCRVVKYHRILLEPNINEGSHNTNKNEKMIATENTRKLIEAIERQLEEFIKMRNKGLKLTAYLRRRRLESQHMRSMVKIVFPSICIHISHCVHKNLCNNQLKERET